MSPTTAGKSSRRKKGTRSLRGRLSLSFLLIAILAVMVPLLGLLQYRWIGQVSAAERERLQENLDISVRRFSDDVIREMERATFAFRLDGVSSEESMEALLTRAWEQWQLTARYPGMIAGVYVVEPGSEAADDRRVRRFEAETGDLTDVPTPAALIGLPTRLEFPNGFRRGGPRPRLDVMPVGAEGIWLPVPLLGRRSIAVGTPAIPLEWVTLRLDSDFVTSTLLPDLVESHFATRDFRVVIFESPTADGVVYRSDETLSREAIPVPDATVSVFGREGGRPPRGGAQGRGSGGGGRGRGGAGFRRGFGPGAPSLTVLGANWQLVVNHRLGSLENAVSAVRARNLAVGFGILGLLAVAGSMAIIWAERVRTLGQMQIEFAAGVSHELRTPLAVIRTAAHNLSQGVIRDPKDVREYAGIVLEEGRRLSSMVDQIMLFAETESGRRHYELKPVDVVRVVAAAIETVSTPAEPSVEILMGVGSDTPAVLADETALRHCLQNLVSNAMKHGRHDGVARVSIDAATDESGRTLRIHIADQGAGIDVADRPHLFEAFYRGRNVSRTPGNGLGLHLVKKMIEGQNGSVRVSSDPGEGARFTLELPLAPEPAGEPLKAAGVTT